MSNYDWTGLRELSDEEIAKVVQESSQKQPINYDWDWSGLREVSDEEIVKVMTRSTFAPE